MTAQVWVQDLWGAGRWPTEADTEELTADQTVLQIRYAFQTLSCESTEWPKPEAFMGALNRARDPMRQRAGNAPRLPAPPPMSENEKAQAEMSRSRFFEQMRRQSAESRHARQGQIVTEAVRGIRRLTGERKDVDPR